MIQEFWPTTSYAQFLTAFLGAATIVCLFSKQRIDMIYIAICMWLVWIFARFATDYGEPFIAAVGIAFASYFLLQSKNEVAHIITGIYVPRLLLLALGELGFISQWWMWELSKFPFLVLQILLLTGGGFDGTYRIISYINNYFNRHGDRVLHVLQIRNESIFLDNTSDKKDTRIV